MLRKFVSSLLLGACLLTGGPSIAQESGRTYVLVHGGWGSIGDWLPVEQALEDAGHRVYLASLTGLGDRAHLRRPDIDLETHIVDVVNLIEVRDLDDIYLVGTSSGGMVITGVWDRVRNRIKHVVYLDAFVPEDGRSAFDYLLPAVDAGVGALAADDDVIALAAENDGWVPLFRYGIPDLLHPLHTFIDPLILQNGPLPRDGARTFIRAVGSDSVQADPTFAQFAEMARRDPGWNYLEIETGHVVQQEDPAGLARLLLDLE